MATIKTKNGKVVLKNNKVSCSCCNTGCSLNPIGGSCKLTFIYTDVNSIQDDAFNIFLLKSNGTWVLAGNIDGACESLEFPPCGCSKVDIKKFDFTIDQSFVSGKANCAIEFKSEMTKDNGCGTFATFDIIGPKGTGFGGYMGGSGLIDITVACF